MVCSNFRQLLESNSSTHLENGLRACFDDHSVATHYVIEGGRLTLFWAEDPSWKGPPLPYPMKYEQALAFVVGWLKGAPRGDEPDIDGSCRADAFILRSPGSIGISDRPASSTYPHYAIAQVEATWSEYHK